MMKSVNQMRAEIYDMYKTNNVSTCLEKLEEQIFQKSNTVKMN